MQCRPCKRCAKCAFHMHELCNRQGKLREDLFWHGMLHDTKNQISLAEKKVKFQSKKAQGNFHFTGGPRVQTQGILRHTTIFMVS